MSTLTKAPDVRRPARLRGRVPGRKVVLGCLLAVMLAAWGLSIAASVWASDAQSRTVAALGGHAHSLAGEVNGGGLSLALALALVMGSWIVMTTAMMLPSSVPMINLFIATAQKAPNWGRSFSFFLLGYFTVWTAFGVLAFGLDLGLSYASSESAWLAGHHEVVLAVALGLGALWQLTSLKDACLKECRHPVSFLLRYYKRGGSAGWNLGVRHGIFCVGCCWALMLVMVVAGAAQLALMGVLALIMLAEKAMPWGEKIVKPVGLAFGLAAVAVLFLGGSDVATHDHVNMHSTHAM